MTIRVVPDTYATILAAYTAALAGDTIYIKESGSPYTEYLDIRKNNLLFEGESTAVEWIAPSANLILSRNPGTEIKDLHLKGAAGHMLWPIYTDLNVHDCILTGNSYSHYLLYGAYVAGSVKVNDCSIYGSFAHGIHTGTTSTTAEILRNHFYKGAKLSSIFTGSVTASGSLTIEDNILDLIGTINDLGSGILLGGSVVSGGSLLIKGNTLLGSELGVGKGANYGIYTTGSNTGVKTITENIISGWFAQYPIYLGSGCSGVTAYFNDFYGGQQTKQGYDYPGSNNWDNGVDKGNYWGYGGAAYDTDGDAIGDDPYELDKNVGSPQDNYPLMCSINIHPDCPYLAAKKKWALGRVGVRFVKL